MYQHSSHALPLMACNIASCYRNILHLVFLLENYLECSQFLAVINIYNCEHFCFLGYFSIGFI